MGIKRPERLLLSTIRAKANQLVMAGLVPAISLRKTWPRLMIEIAGTSPAISTESVWN
jgi:hypothetical protein